MRGTTKIRHNRAMREPADPTLAHLLNQSCQCITLDERALDRALHDACAGVGLGDLSVTHPHLFSRSAVFVEEATLQRMREVVAAVERLVSLPSYRARVLAEAHPHAQVETPALGAFLGFDFHLSEA